MKRIFFTTIVLVILAGSGFYFMSKTKPEADQTQSQASQNTEAIKTESPAMQKETMKEEVATQDPKDSMSTGTDSPSTAMEKKAGAYVEYSVQALSEAAKNNGKAVLFFHAKWCPFCKTADQAFSSRTQEIPAGVTVLKTDYDTEKELRTKYGVTYQHTFVQVDANGNQITKWNGGDIETLKSNIK